MISNFNIAEFIGSDITGRKKSLLHNDLVQFDSQLRKNIENKSVLVIGGAGTIGSSYIKALLKFKVRKLYVIDINENGLTELVRDLRSGEDLFIPDDLKTYPINFGDAVFERMFRKEGPFEIVANFAAHKHVRSEKDIYSVQAMIENNVLKAKRFLDLLLEFPPERFFCVSTDKAANPVNIMGASKKLMEDVILAYSSKLHITTARFANVAFSNGSLLQGFMERLGKQQPWACPLSISRYFVSPEESGQICMMASILGESGDIFFPKLDPAKDLVKFSDIATHLLKALNIPAEICDSEEEAKRKMADYIQGKGGFPVHFFESDTTGEKDFEEFFTTDEKLDMATFQSLGVIKEAKKRGIPEIELLFSRMKESFANENITKQDIVNVMKEYLPNFEHMEKGKYLDQRM